MPPILPRACLPVLLSLLAACGAPQPPDEEAPLPPERAADGSCWAREHIPAIYEQVQGEVLEKFAEQMRTGQMNPEVMAEMMGPTFQFGRQFVETLGRSMESMMKAATDAQPSKDSKS